MPSFDIIKPVKAVKTFRTSAIISNFDIDTAHIDERFTGEINPPEGWKIGLIVGGSGTGKTTIAREVFKDAYFCGYDYKAAAVVDDMPKGAGIKDIEKAFTSVGFSSPPSWLKPYNVLSNGEKMRVDLARCILDDRELIVFDEFTSVVNRECAKTTACAMAKAIRRSGKQFIAVSCHDDIIEWLQPDWIYDTDQKHFFTPRESTTARESNLKYIGSATGIKEQYGKYLESITI